MNVNRAIVPLLQMASTVLGLSVELWNRAMILVAMRHDGRRHNENHARFVVAHCSLHGKRPGGYNEEAGDATRWKNHRAVHTKICCPPHRNEEEKPPSTPADRLPPCRVYHKELLWFLSFLSMDSIEIHPVHGTTIEGSHVYHWFPQENETHKDGGNPIKMKCETDVMQHGIQTDRQNDGDSEGSTW